MVKGHASRGLSILFRLGELTCGAIVLGIVGRLLDLVDEGAGDPNPRLIYAVVISSLTIIFSLFFILPMTYSFWSFPIDLFMFAAWLVVFVLLETLTGTSYCNSTWYNTYWGYYWGCWYRVAPVGVNVNCSGCSAWRTVLAFTFVSIFTHLLSFCLGLYWIIKHGKFRERTRKLLRRGYRGDAANAGEKGTNPRAVDVESGVMANEPPTAPTQTGAAFGNAGEPAGADRGFGPSSQTQTINPLGSSPPEASAPVDTVSRVDNPDASSQMGKPPA